MFSHPGGKNYKDANDETSRRHQDSFDMKANNGHENNGLGLLMENRRSALPVYPENGKHNDDTNDNELHYQKKNKNMAKKLVKKVVKKILNVENLA